MSFCMPFVQLQRLARTRTRPTCKIVRPRPRLELLEDRNLLSFNSPLTIPFGLGEPIRIVAADFNRDGGTDLAVLGSNGEISVFLGKGDGAFRSAFDQVSVNGVTPFDDLQTVDLNGDGKLDLLIASDVTAQPGGFASGYYVMFGHGDGTFDGARPFGVPAPN